MTLGRTLWRHKLFLSCLIVAAIALTSLRVGQAPAVFVAETLLLLSAPSHTSEASETPGAGVQGGVEEGEIRALRSLAMAERLVDALSLHMLPEFNPALRAETTGLRSWFDPSRLVPNSLFNRLPATWREILSESAAVSDQEQADSLRGSIADLTLTHITAKPTDRPSVVRVTFASADPRLAALGANSLAEMYVADRLAAQQAASTKARSFLLSEISRLRAAISDTSLQQLRAQVAPADGVVGTTADDLVRANQADHDLLQTYLARVQEIDAVQESTEPDAQVISAATTPDQPTDPRRKLTFGAAIFGALLVGSLAALGLDRLDNTISSSEQLRQIDLRGLGMLPEVRGGRGHQAPDRQVLDDPSGHFACAVTSLRNELVRNSVISRRKSVLLASALRNEGATTTALSLVRCHARAGGHALLIDCDPQSGRLQEVTGKGELGSLEDIVAGDQTADEVLRVDERSGVALVALGAKGGSQQAPAPASLSRLLRWAEERYDLVILDGPPVIGSDQAALLAKVADATILVAHWGCTRRRDVATARQALVDAGADLAGIVLTRVKSGTFGSHA